MPRTRRGWEGTAHSGASRKAELMKPLLVRWKEETALFSVIL